MRIDFFTSDRQLRYIYEKVLKVQLAMKECGLKN